MLVNKDGELLDQPTSGLPEPGYHIELPDAVNTWLEKQGIDTNSAEDLSPLLHFAYDQDAQQREWTMTYMGVYDANAEGEATQYVYSLNPAKDNEGNEIPVRIMYLHPATQDPIQDDQIGMTLTPFLPPTPSPSTPASWSRIRFRLCSL